MKPLPNKGYALPRLKTKAKAGPFNRDGNLYEDVWQIIRLDWDRTCRAYEANPGSFYNAWNYLDDHPIYWRIRDGRPPSAAAVTDTAASLRSAIAGQDALASDTAAALTAHVDRMERLAAGRPLHGGPRLHVRNLDYGTGFAAGGIDITVVRVNPADGKISEDEALNTRVRFWYETGEWTWGEQESRVHAYQLDGAADTYEQAVTALARKVHRFYGNDRARCAP